MSAEVIFAYNIHITDYDEMHVEVNGVLVNELASFDFKSQWRQWFLYIFYRGSKTTTKIFEIQNNEKYQ